MINLAESSYLILVPDILSCQGVCRLKREGTIEKNLNLVARFDCERVLDA